MNAPKVPNVRTLGPVRATTEALAAGEARHARLLADHRENERKVAALCARPRPEQVDLETPAARLRADAGKLVAGTTDAETIARAHEEEERRVSLEGLYRRRELLTEAVSQSGKLLASEQRAFSAAGCAAVADQHRGLAAEVARGVLAAVAGQMRLADFLQDLSRQGIDVDLLPDLGAEWFDLKRDPHTPVGELLVRAIARGIIEPAELPTGVDGYIGGRGMEERNPPRKKEPAPMKPQTFNARRFPSF